MGTTRLLQIPSYHATAALPPIPPPFLLTNPYNSLCQNPITSTRSRFSKSSRCRSTTVYGGRSRPHWDSNAEKTVRAKRFRFNSDDEVAAGKEDDDRGGGGFGFRSGAKKRVWWSDDSVDTDDYEEGFGALEDSIDDASWIFKVLNAFGWMLPAIGISLLLGTGPNAFFMALVLPIAQSAVSLATNAFWGRSGGSRKPRRRTKKKPYARAASDIGSSREEKDDESSKVRENYQSWGAANDTSTKTREKRAPGFGGWDELDKRMGSDKVPIREPTRTANEPRQHKRGKLSMRVRSRDTPLLLRLLIAVFPFLGSWTKLL